MPRPRSWTDDDLRAAVAGATSYAEVVRRLRLSHGGGAYVTVRTRIEQLGVSTDHFASEARACGPSDPGGTSNSPGTRSTPGPSDEDLTAAVAASRSLNEVFGRLGLSVGGSQWQRLRRRIVSLGVSTSHWSHPLQPRVSTIATLRAQLAAHDLVALAEGCTSRAQLLRRAGIEPSSTAYRVLAEALAQLGPDVVRLDARPAGSAVRRRPLEQILVEDSDWTNTSELRQRLIAEGVKQARCERCGLEFWQGEPIPLQLDHVNGDRRDHRIENLRVLCACCHALTPTWGARNRGRPALREARTGYAAGEPR